MKKKNYKYSIIYEGQNEEIFINNLKNICFKRKTLSLCNSCRTYCINRTVSKKDINNLDACKKCQRFIIIDKDNLDDEMFNILNKKDVCVIKTDPCFELILCSIFYNKKNLCSLSKKNLHEILSKELKLNEYKHKNENVAKLFEKYLKKDPDYKNLNHFMENLIKLNKNNKSNFIELFNFLKGENNG